MKKMVFLYDSTKNDFEEFQDLMADFNNMSNEYGVIVTGVVSLWDGKRVLGCNYFDTISEAIDKCLGDDAYGCVIAYDGIGGTYDISVSHHDGMNSFTIHNVSKHGHRLNEFKGELKHDWVRRMPYLYD